MTWIAMAQRLPDEDGRYIAYWASADEVRISKFMRGSWLYEAGMPVNQKLARITHWMPLPAAPKS